MGYFLASGLRRLLQNPTKLIGPYVTPGMTVLDFGCAMGFFSLPLAEAVGPEGKVVCVDVQPKMFKVLQRRAARAGLADRIETHACREDSIALDRQANRFDFALVFAVLHEVADPNRILGELAQLVKPNAHLLLAEPAGHVERDAFEDSVALAREHGFVPSETPSIRWAHASLLTRVAS
jgi:2-polyprenyl-3-methyl-5-hydroxy-6-metoxy-1,4-benzoquinol methylase